MSLYLLLQASLLCRAHLPLPAVVRHAGLAGVVLALCLAISDAGLELGVATWLVFLMASGGMAPVILLALDGAIDRFPAMRAALWRRLMPGAK